MAPETFDKTNAAFAVELESPQDFFLMLPIFECGVVVYLFNCSHIRVLHVYYMYLLVLHGCTTYLLQPWGCF